MSKRSSHSRAFSSLRAFIASLLLSTLNPQVAAAVKPKFIILFSDDMDYGNLSCLGHPTSNTAHLDNMASEGLRLTSFDVAPWCVPSRSQLLLGRYSARTTLGRMGSGGKGEITDDEVTLAQSLKKAGYRTVMVGKWHLGYQQVKYLPVGKGFDYW